MPLIADQLVLIKSLTFRSPAVALGTVLCLLLGGGMSAVGQESPARPGYSADVVAKAEQVLSEAGLKRQGKLIVSETASELNRVATDLNKKQRSVQQAASQHTAVTKQLQRLGEQLRLLNLQNVELNDRLVTLAGDIASNNRLVALINRNTSAIEELRLQREELRGRVNLARQERVDAETNFASSIAELRERYNELLPPLEEKLDDSQVAIAIRVIHANFQTPEKLTLADLLGPLDRRVKQLEKQIQQEAITLVKNDRGGLTVPVTIDASTLEMVVDTGSSLTILTDAAANELSISVPAAADQVRLVLADGTAWHGKMVTIPKMRVGTFEASDVEVAVLEPDATTLQPTLGQSFLGQFQSSVDSHAGELKLLRMVP